MSSARLSIAVDANALAWGWGGIPKVTHRIVSEWATAADLDVTLLANAHRPFTDIPVVRHAWGRRKGASVWRETFVLPWLVRNRPDVFWAPETVLPWPCPVPSVVTVHDLAPLLFPGIKPRRHELEFRTAVRRSVRAADAVVAVSRATARDLRRLWGISEESVRVVPLGVDDAFRTGDRTAAASAVRSRHGIASPYILFVGTLEPRKGLPVLLETAEAARASGEPWHVVLVGSPGHRGEELARAAVRAGCTVLAGTGDGDLVDLYRAAEALVIPSLYEGFGLTPLEAMACGTPAVVAADAGALAETAGPGAVIVRARTAAAWLDGIRDALARREALGAAGLAHAARFRWPEVAAQTLDIAREAAALSPRSVV